MRIATREDVLNQHYEHQQQHKHRGRLKWREKSSKSRIYFVIPFVINVKFIISLSSDEKCRCGWIENDDDTKGNEIIHYESINIEDESEVTIFHSFHNNNFTYFRISVADTEEKSFTQASFRFFPLKRRQRHNSRAKMWRMSILKLHKSQGEVTQVRQRLRIIVLNKSTENSYTTIAYKNCISLKKYRIRLMNFNLVSIAFSSRYFI